MKKVTLTEKQKKVLKAAAIIAGWLACVGIGVDLISRTELGNTVKTKVINSMMRSKCKLNGYNFQMNTFVSTRVCPDEKVVEKAFDKAYEVFKQIIQEANDT